MRLSVIGTGYVGLVTGVGYASLGHDVTCIDIDAAKVNSVNSGKPHFFEEGLDRLLKKVIGAKKFHATTSFDSVEGADVVFICVGTPSRQDGSIDLSYIEKASATIGRELRSAKKFVTIVVKSTVIPGTTSATVRRILERESGKKAGKGFGLAMIPEFLREGVAVKDFFEPDRIVIGSFDKKARKTLLKLNSKFKCPFLETNPATAEMIKYASNSFLATKISFINEIANLCEKSGADVVEVAKGMGLDKRISPHFLNAGAGFGGSCFPKDVKALAAFAREKDYSPRILEAALSVNEKQPLRMVELAREALGNLKAKRICVLGLAFKPGTDDVREAPSLRVISELGKAGSRITAFDPKASENALKFFPWLECASSFEDAVRGADCCLIVTEWKEFYRPARDYKRLLKKPIVIDGRRVLNPIEAAKAGLVYKTIGLGE